MNPMHPIRLALVCSLLGIPATARAQGSGPAQGRPEPHPPTTQAQPPAVNPADLTSGLPRVDTGGNRTNTAPDTTANIPLPRTENTAPPAPDGPAPRN
ncbi:hypothetical protein [Roseomonas sp. BN140053]|uniref:hypothetical protein n=1 Tax=Roseomonas sp. BN140053 TaxID=3391898 RepID=UPI0039E9E806